MSRNSWIPGEALNAVEEAVRVWYVDRDMCQRWNSTRREGELRLLTGWCWIEKRSGGQYRHGFKTKTVALRDAYYTVVAERLAPRPAANLRRAA